MNSCQEDEYFDGFSWAVPTAFADALAACRFEQGDMLYDTRLAYNGTWGEAQQHIKHSIQVQSPMHGYGTKSDQDTALVFLDNWRMPVVFTLKDLAAAKSATVQTTQGQLYSLLWKDDLAIIHPDSPLPPAPVLAMQILDNLPAAEDYARTNLVAPGQSRIVFLMPYDRSQVLFRIKFAKVKKSLTRFVVRPSLVPPALAGLPSEGEFAPTVSIACFALERGSPREVEGALKQALYTPVRDRKTAKDAWRLSRHGHLIMS